MYKQHQNVPRLESIVVNIINAAATTINFPKVPNLDGGYLVAMRAYTVTQLPVNKNGSAVPPLSVLQRCFITLKGRNNEDLVTDLPYLELLRENYAGLFYSVGPLAIDWEKSFIRFEGATLSGEVGKGIQFGLHYQLYKDDNAVTRRDVIGERA